MPFKSNADRQHHIPKQRHRVTHWAECHAGLRARSSLTAWITAEAIECLASRGAPGAVPRSEVPEICDQR